jgi:hypothetical protein
MKNLIKSFLAGMLLIVSVISCSDSDASIDTLYDEVDTTTGVILRFTTPPKPILSLSGNGPFPNVFETVNEVQQGNGTVAADFKEVRLYITIYSDNDLSVPVLNQDGTMFTEDLLTTLSSSDYSTISSNGLPSYSMSMQTQEFLDRYPNIVPPSNNNLYLRMRYELEMNSGVIYDETNTGASLDGGFFESPFFYKVLFRSGS